MDLKERQEFKKEIQ